VLVVNLVVVGTSLRGTKFSTADKFENGLQALILENVLPNLDPLQYLVTILSGWVEQNLGRCDRYSLAGSSKIKIRTSSRHRSKAN
jgi:hypothetical protein